MKHILFLTFGLLATAAHAQKKQPLPTPAPDSTYGYTAANPMRFKQGSLGKSISASQLFLRDLRTPDDQALALLGRRTASDPAYSRPAVQLTNRSTGLPVNGQGGILDVYLFRTAQNDTLRLYVDVYHKGPRLVPKGLKYVGL